MRSYQGINHRSVIVTEMENISRSNIGLGFDCHLEERDVLQILLPSYRWSSSSKIIGGFPSGSRREAALAIAVMTPELRFIAFPRAVGQSLL